MHGAPGSSSGLQVDGGGPASAGWAATMLRSLRAVDFRCYPELALEVPPGGALITGANAQGKTSILEAVCLLVRLHSPRSSRMAHLARLGGSGGFGLAGEAWDDGRRVRWQPRRPLQLEVGGERRATQGDYLGDGGLLVWMGNEDLELVRGRGESRRRYLDFLGAQLEPGYRRALARYRRALKAKNLLLKDGRPREEEIASYEGILIESGGLLGESRQRLVEWLQPAAAAAQREIAGVEEPLQLDYDRSGGEDLARAIEQAHERERRQRQALVGPHRDELRLVVNGLPAGDFASEGQQRTLALALKLAQGRVLEARGGRQPLWLIDDVFGELDPARRNALLRALPEGAQKWITTTHLGWLEEGRGLDGLERLEVKGGAVNPTD